MPGNASCAFPKHEEEEGAFLSQLLAQEQSQAWVVPGTLPL